MWSLSSLAKDGTHVPYLGRWIFNHWTISEVQRLENFEPQSVYLICLTIEPWIYICYSTSVSLGNY